MKTKLSNVSSKYGAPMGRSNRIPQDISKSTKLYYERLRWVSKDYDPGGAYWGGGMGDYIYRVHGETKTEHVEIFVRAKNLKEAKDNTKSLLVNYPCLKAEACKVTYNE